MSRMMQDKFETFLKSFRAGTLTDEERAEFADELEAMRHAEDRLLNGVTFAVHDLSDGNVSAALERLQARMNEVLAGFVATMERGDA